MVATQSRPSAASGHGRDAVAAEARRVRGIVAEVREAARLGVEAVETTVVGAEPEAAIAILEDRGDAVGG